MFRISCWDVPVYLLAFKCVFFLSIAYLWNQTSASYQGVWLTWMWSVRLLKYHTPASYSGEWCTIRNHFFLPHSNPKAQCQSDVCLCAVFSGVKEFYLLCVFFLMDSHQLKWETDTYNSLFGAVTKYCRRKKWGQISVPLTCCKLTRCFC